jgi:membrane-bound serine protease (ClpP class)
VLFNSSSTYTFEKVSLPLVIATGLITAAMFLIILGMAWRAQRAPIYMGQESLVGRVGVARSPIQPGGSGQVHLGGESWTAELAADAEPIASGERVEVVEVEGVRLKVRKKQVS